MFVGQLFKNKKIWKIVKKKTTWIRKWNLKKLRIREIIFDNIHGYWRLKFHRGLSRQHFDFRYGHFKYV